MNDGEVLLMQPPLRYRVRPGGAEGDRAARGDAEGGAGGRGRPAAGRRGAGRVRRLAHLSDLHFGRTDQAVVDGLVEALRAERPGPGHRQRRLHAERQARGVRGRQGVRRPLDAPVFAVPGNHDIPAYQLLQRFLDPYARYRRWIAQTSSPSGGTSTSASSASTRRGARRWS
jgi:hypothetical protein